MSYDVDLCCASCRRPVMVDSHTEGGTYVVGGSSEASMSVTYNYSPHFHRVLDPEEGLHWLHEKSGLETAGRLLAGIDQLKDDRVDDYWAPTEGNARHALSVLLLWATRNPTAVWRVG